MNQANAARPDTNAGSAPPRAAPRRLGLKSLLPCLALSLAALTGCATNATPKTIEISQAQLQEMVTRRFPYSARWLETIDVRASAPRLTLQPDANSVAAEIEVSATDRVFNRTHRGALAVASGLRFEPLDNSVRFTNVRVSRFGVQGLPAAYGPDVAQLGALLAQQLLENYPVYTVPPAQVELLKNTSLKVGSMRITATGLSIALEPSLQ